MSGTSCMSGFSCLLMGDLSPAFLPGLYNYSKVVTTASLPSGSGALLEPRVIFQPSLALFTSGLSLHHHFLFRTTVSLLVCLCQVFTKKFSNSNQTEETPCYQRYAATKRKAQCFLQSFKLFRPDILAKKIHNPDHIWCSFLSRASLFTYIYVLV